MTRRVLKVTLVEKKLKESNSVLNSRIVLRSPKTGVIKKWYVLRNEASMEDSFLNLIHSWGVYISFIVALALWIISWTVS